MISFITIILFFIYTWGLGFTATYFLKRNESTAEQFFTNIGIGLGVFSIVAILLNLFHLPLDWKIFLVLSLALPSYFWCNKFRRKNVIINRPKFTWSNVKILLVLVIFAISLSMYLLGAFSYPYFEDEDPWGHAVGVKYVALEKTAFDPPLVENGNTLDVTLSYIDPYPPAYDILLGLLHQTSPDIQWTMKFFNALLISFGIIFFYFTANLLLKSQNKALVATIILAAIPSYLSHFIWAHTLAVTLFFPAIYAFEKIKDNQNWTYLALLMVGAIWVSQNLEQPIKIATMLLLYVIIVSVINHKLWIHGFAALIGGIILSFSWWGAVISKYGLSGLIGSVNPNAAETAVNSVATSGILDKLLSIIYSLTYAGGSASRAYGFNDFFLAKSQNMINNPIGIGVVITILALIGVAYTLFKYRQLLANKENCSLAVVLFWLIFTFWGVNGETFPVSIARGAFRTWMLMAVPVALIATEGIYGLQDIINKITKNKIIWQILAVIIFMGILFTSAKPKYDLNTAIWPTSGAFTNPEEPFLLAGWFKTIPDDTKVFIYSPRQKLVIGWGKLACDWCQEEINFRSKILDKTSLELHTFLKQNEYEYLLIVPSIDSKILTKKFTEKLVQEKLPQKYQEILNSGLFTVVYNKDKQIIALKVK